MVTLFGEDAPADLTPAWFGPRFARCEAQIWALALQLGQQGIPSILDLGFQRRQHRQRYASQILAAGFSARLHLLDVDPAVRWERVQSRNLGQGKTYQMEITRDMFDYIETIWERPNSEEIAMIANL